MLIFNNISLLKKFAKPFLIFARTKKKWWYPDAEYINQFKGPVMFPDEVTSKWKRLPWNAKIPPKEVKIKNMIINFGCAHPAAHGLLRLVLELDGEVSN